MESRITPSEAGTKRSDRRRVIMRVSLDSAASSPPASPAAGASLSDSPRPGSPLWLWLGLGGLALLAASFEPMRTHTLPRWAAVAFAAGCLAWVAVAIRAAGRKCETLGPLDAPSPLPPRVWALAPLALMLAALSWTHTVGGRFQPGGTACWLFAILVWFAAWWPSRRRPPAAESAQPALPSVRDRGRLPRDPRGRRVLPLLPAFGDPAAARKRPRRGPPQRRRSGTRRASGLLPQQHRTAPAPVLLRVRPSQGRPSDQLPDAQAGHRADRHARDPRDVPARRRARRARSSDSARPRSAPGASGPSSGRAAG